VDVSVAQAARAVGVTEEAVRAQLREGRLRGRRVQVGRRQTWRVDAAEVAAWKARRPKTDLYPPAAVVQVAGETGELEALRREVAELRQALKVVTRYLP
jgi:excisionase family DNA binding protein